MNYNFDIHKSKQLDILDPISIEAYGIIDSCQVNMHLSTSLMGGLNIDGDDNE
ncbi:168_t:CDS:2 [Funneliformis caledonium]|uniref:168_t:CDS:1 n=1 Tax=Funneliformis caledonium TaxID=1117310 RepID=A0A9N8YPJ3_9GLOM|nr:168_t:CDS:2 [Funneliformis caledonium]